VGEVSKDTLSITPDRKVMFGRVRNSADTDPKAGSVVLAQQRQAAILDRVRAAGGVRVSELATEYGVSDMTIRRDLESLADRGLLAKVHGGATTVSPGSAHEPGFAAKSVRQRAEKAAMAMHAASLVSPGDAIALSAGTTTAGLAQRLVDVPSLTVVTNSIPVADVFYRAGRPDQTVVLTGGTRTPSDALVGPVAVAAIGTLHLDMLFLGVHGMSERAGYTTPNLMEADVNRALVEAAERLVVLADHTKWGTVGISSIVPLERADVLITDDGLDDQARTLLEDTVPELVVVSGQ
jgi:DeoR/GlpR family transcriptional regulator of sugar metabolism